MRIFVASLPRLTGLLALVIVSACSADSPMDPLGANFAKGGHKPPPPPPPAPTHDPILFVHGLNASSSTWTTMYSRFQNDGWSTSELVNWSYDYTKSNATTAGLISKKVDSILKATGAAKVDIITHSMGAMSARYYVRNLGGDGKVDALVTLGGANHGTTTASLCSFIWVSCTEMLPGSTFLANLNSIDESWGTPRYGAWWSPCDEVINPLSSAQLSGGAFDQETACLQHSDLHEDPTVYAQVRDFVNVAPVLAVSP